MAAPHYHFVTRMLCELHAAGRLPHVESIDVEPEYGRATRIAYTSGATRLTHGNDVGLNSGAAGTVVGDKAYTKYFLDRLGFRSPPGSAFVTRWRAAQLGPRLEARGFTAIRTVEEMPGYLRRELPFPVYLKPGHGTQGAGVWRCETQEEVDAVIETYEQTRVRIAVVEAAIDLPDHRLVVLHGRLLSAYQRIPLSVVGDGRSTILELLERKQAEYAAAGRDTRLPFGDPRLGARLLRLGMTAASVPPAGERVQLLDVSNLSTGGTAVDLTAEVADRWASLAIDVADALGLAFCGIDLACPDIRSPDGEYAILEVNATPGLDHYAAVGDAQLRVVRDMYAAVFDEPPR